jgi:hypothetical protein
MKYRSTGTRNQRTTIEETIRWWCQKVTPFIDSLLTKIIHNCDITTSFKKASSAKVNVSIQMVAQMDVRLKSRIV